MLAWQHKLPGWPVFLGTYEISDVVMVVVRSKEDVVSLHLKLDWHSGLEAGVVRGGDCVKPHGVLVGFVVNPFLFLPLLNIGPSFHSAFAFELISGQI